MNDLPILSTIPAREHGSSDIRSPFSAILIEAAGSTIASLATSSAIRQAAGSISSASRAARSFGCGARCRWTICSSATRCVPASPTLPASSLGGRDTLPCPRVRLSPRRDELSLYAGRARAAPVRAGSRAGAGASRRKGRGQRIVLVYRNPLGQAASYYRYCQDHRDPTYSSFKGQPLASVPFHDYLFESALPSYAKQFISFQALATRHPDLVRLVSYERLMSQPLDVVSAILDHLSGTPEYRAGAARCRMAGAQRASRRHREGTRPLARRHAERPRQPHAAGQCRRTHAGATARRAAKRWPCCGTWASIPI